MKTSVLLYLASILLLSGQSSAADQQQIQYSDFQKGFIKIIAEYAAKYPKGENELQKSALVTERNNHFRTLNGDPRKIKGWVGVLESMGTTSEGKAYITVRLSPPPRLLTFSTWNNSLSDFQDRSLIPQSSPLFMKLAALKKGNVVKFSGRLKHTKNLTEEGKMVSPDFLFIFSSIEKIGDFATP